MKKPKSEYAIQTVTNALRLLEELRSEDELGVTELAMRLGLHKNNVFRLLATLQERGFVEQCPPPSERYRLGLGTLKLGQGFLRSRPLLRLAPPRLAELVKQTGESSHLTVMRDFEVVHLLGATSRSLLLTSSRIGMSLPVHCTASGKVLLACSLEKVREAYDHEVVAARGLEQCTSTTIVDSAKLFEHVSSVAVQGFAIDIEECEEGLCCAAAPVFDATGEVVAALSVSGPKSRLNRERVLSETVPFVMAAAERLSRELGYAT